MVTEFIRFADDQAANRAALAAGVSGATCTYAGRCETQPAYDVSPTLAHEIARLMHDMPATQLPGTLEVYANGAANMFVRYNDRVLGFYQIR